MNTALATLALALVPPPSDFVPPVLHAYSVEFGTSAPGATMPISYLGLVPGTTLGYSLVSGMTDAGDIAVLAVAPSLAAVPIPLGAGFLKLDPAAIVILAVGTLDPTGAKSFTYPLAPGLTVGAPLAAQGATLDPTTLELRPSNALTHAVTDLAPTVIQTFLHSGHAASATAGALVLTDGFAWQDFWNSHSGAGTAPAVDFATQVVVVGFGGWMSTGGYSLAIDALEPLPGGGLLVRQTLTTPGSGCPVIFVETQPGQIVAVDRVAGGSPVAAATQVVVSPPCP